jgi:hypothetical protein
VLKSHLLLMCMRFAVSIRMKCPKGRTDLWSSSTVSLSMKAYSRNLCWYGRSYSLLLHGFDNSVAVDKMKPTGALTSLIPLCLAKLED